MSFEELTKRISSKLKGIIYKIHRTSHSFSEDDLYQEAILQLWYDYQDGKLSDKTDSYVLQGCYFYLKNYMRKLQDETSLMSANMPINEGGTQLQELLSLKEDVDEDTDIDDLMEKVFKDELTRKEKEIVFFYLQGWTTREIGLRLGISHVTIVKIEEKIREKCKKLKESVEM